jgi:hypothetical protein
MKEIVTDMIGAACVFAIPFAFYFIAWGVQ